MSLLPENAKKIEVEGSSLEFYTYTIGENIYFQFDSSMTGPPEPMVNAMVGLNLVTDKNKKLVMINHKSPGGLIAKIGENYDIEESILADGKVKLIFSYKDGDSEKADLSDKTCG